MISYEMLERKYRQQIQALGTSYGISNIRVFGSVARGEEHEGSDLDLLVKVEPGRTLLDLVGFEQDLSELLGVRVQAISENGVSPHMKTRILQEARKL